jgi:hypothetical protein
VNPVWNKEELPGQWKESYCTSSQKGWQLTVIIIVGYHCWREVLYNILIEFAVPMKLSHVD